MVEGCGHDALAHRETAPCLIWIYCACRPVTAYQHVTDVEFQNFVPIISSLSASATHPSRAGAKAAGRQDFRPGTVANLIFAKGGNIMANGRTAVEPSRAELGSTTVYFVLCVVLIMVQCTVPS